MFRVRFAVSILSAMLFAIGASVKTRTSTELKKALANAGEDKGKVKNDFCSRLQKLTL